MLKRIFVIAILGLAILGTSSAQALPNITVTLRTNPGAPQSPVTFKTCSVTVPASSNGITVLNAAVASHCIGSYTVTNYPGYGDFVECIDGLCGEPQGTGLDDLVTFWWVTVNGVSADKGVTGYVAKTGETLGFSYTASVVCFVPC